MAVAWHEKARCGVNAGETTYLRVFPSPLQNPALLPTPKEASMRRSVLVLSLVLVSAAAGGVLFDDRVVQAAAKIMEVAEQNLDSNGFIRVHEQGTANVAVTNFPATQSVIVSNLPATQNVAVTNLPLREPFTAGESIVAQTIPDGDFSGEHTFNVPAGTRLVIEAVNAQFLLPSSQPPFVLFIDAVHNGTTYRYRFSAHALALGGYHNVEAQTTIHADPGSTVRVVASRFPNTAGNASFVYSVSGYLEGM
jgi:hypothetical protein